MVSIVPVSQPIDEDLVAGLIARQFPRWSGLRVQAVEHQGWDNRTFRLGSALVARLPTTPRVERRAAIEVEVLPALAAGVSLPIPTVVAVGHEEAAYPFRLTVLNWLDGTPLRDSVGVDQRLLASDLAGFLLELRALPPAGGPIHPVGLGQPLEQWDGQVRAALERFGDRVDARRARTIWAAALPASEQSVPSWFHGDIAPGNLLMRDGRLAAVIDFGSVGVGDPSCDLAFAWTTLGAVGREVFRRERAPDEAEWHRGMGWALWSGLTRADDPDDGASARRVLDALRVLLELRRAAEEHAMHREPICTRVPLVGRPASRGRQASRERGTGRVRPSRHASSHGRCRRSCTRRPDRHGRARALARRERS